MKRTTRYILYFMVGVIIYYFLEGDKNPENLEVIHEKAPIAIIVVFILLLLVQYIKKRKQE